MVAHDVAGSARPGTPGDTLDDFVEIRLPADGAYMSVLRTATAGLAARLDFTIDEIEDLRIAVGEACAMLLQQAVPDAELLCRFTLEPDTLSVEVTAPTREGRVPQRDSFAWQVLSALAGAAEASVDSDRHVTIVLHKTRASAW